MRGGEARALTDGKTGVTRFAWSPDGSAIAFLAPEPRSEEDEERIEDKDDARVCRQGRPASAALARRPPLGDVSALTTGGWRISSFDWHPDGDRLIVAATDHPQPELETTRMYTLSTSAPAMSELARPLGPVGPFGGVSVSPDGATVAYVGARDSPVPHDLYVQPLAGGAAKNLTAKSIDLPVAGYHWRRTGRSSCAPPRRCRRAFSSFASTAARRRSRLSRERTRSALSTCGATGWPLRESRRRRRRSYGSRRSMVWPRRKVISTRRGQTWTSSRRRR